MGAEQHQQAVVDEQKNQATIGALCAMVQTARFALREWAEATKLGIPKEFQPKLNFNWACRGQNEYSQRRDELRRLAKAEIDALEKVARVQIESTSVQAQTEIIANGLNSDAALEFLNRLPAIESMMPALDVSSIQQKLAERARRSGDYSGPRLIE